MKVVCLFFFFFCVWLGSEVVSAAGGKDGRRGLERERVPVGSEGGWSESEGAGLEHVLGEWSRVCMGCDTEVAEHGVGFPATEELDDVGVDARAQ
jgi:hypothetical protein